MVDMTLLQGFIFGCVGGLLAEILGLFKLRRESRDNYPDWMKSPFYWIITGMMILSGGVLTYIYLWSGFELSALLAANIGASAPLAIGAFVSQVPNPEIRVD